MENIKILQSMKGGQLLHKRHCEGRSLDINKFRTHHNHSLKTDFVVVPCSTRDKEHNDSTNCTILEYLLDA